MILNIKTFRLQATAWSTDRPAEPQPVGLQGQFVIVVVHRLITKMWKLIKNIGLKDIIQARLLACWRLWKATNGERQRHEDLSHTSYNPLKSIHQRTHGHTHIFQSGESVQVNSEDWEAQGAVVGWGQGVSDGLSRDDDDDIYLQWSSSWKRYKPSAYRLAMIQIDSHVRLILEKGPCEVNVLSGLRHCCCLSHLFQQIFTQ